LVAVFCSTLHFSILLDPWSQTGQRISRVNQILIVLGADRQVSLTSTFFSRVAGTNLKPILGVFPGCSKDPQMLDLSQAFASALWQIVTLNPQLLQIISVSLKVTLTAVAIATLLGFAIGGVLAVYRFPGRGAVAALLTSLMGLPPVVAGLIVYLLLSNAGPLGVLQLLYTPGAMIIAQAILITPIVAALTRQTCEDLLEEYRDQLRSLGASSAEMVTTLLWDGRYRLITAVLAGFGRAIAEVGAVMIVGGNIDHVTRTMTTAIALETSKGNITLALALGIILLAIALVVNVALMSIRRLATRFAYA
jgi:tungstate transport system permease protein